MTPREIFLSHSSHDLRQARRLRMALLAHRIPVWFSPHHIQGGQQWHDEIGKALKRCDWFMVLLTQHAVESKWVKRELRYAVENFGDDRIIPLLFKKCNFSELSWTIAQSQIVDFSRNFWAGLRKLLEVWDKRLDVKVRKDLDRK